MRRVFAAFLKINVVITEKFLHRFPLLANSVFYGGVYAVSDLSQQIYVTPLATGKSRKPINEGSVFRCWFLGTFVMGPCVTTFVRFANILIPGTSIIAAVKKVLLDQCVMAFPMISIFYLGLNLLEGNSFQTFFEEWKAKFYPTWKTGVCFWPFAQMISWTKVPHIWRPRYIACCSFVWTNFMCYMKNKPNVEIVQTAK
jgi:Mpv17-like protein